MNVNLKPIQEFRYNQISNYKFQYLMVDENFQALHSPFECKDYITDIFFCEYRGVSSLVYGMEWKPGMLDMNSEWFYLALLGGKETLNDRVGPLTEFLNIFEEAQKIPLSGVMGTDDEKIIVVRFHKNWTENGPLVSAFTTCIRISGTYSGGDIMEYLKALKNKTQPVKDYMKVDVNRIDQSIKKLAALLAGKKVKAKWTDLDDIYTVHNTGIIAYDKFPEVEI